MSETPALQEATPKPGAQDVRVLADALDDMLAIVVSTATFLKSSLSADGARRVGWLRIGTG